MRILLVRHGDARGQAEIFHGISQESLTSEGREEVYRTAKEIKSYKPTIIYYDSTCERTRETAKILSDELSIVRKAAPQLAPLDLGTFVGKNTDKYLDAVRHYLTHTNEKIPNGESVDGWAAKYLGFFEKYYRNKTKQTIIMVTHGRNILLTKGYIKGGNLAPSFDKSVLLESKTTTERGGYAIADGNSTPHFEIVDKMPIPAGRS